MRASTRREILTASAQADRVDGARRTRTQRRFSALPRRSASHFPAISNDFGGIAFRFSQDAPTDAPTLIWLPRNHPGRRWMTKSYLSTGFPGVFHDFWTFVDVAGSLGRLATELAV
jgi:hypothetical protein